MKSLFSHIRISPVALSWIIILSVTLIWGSSFLMLKKALVVFSPQQVVAGRMSVAGLVFLPLSVRYMRGVPRAMWGRLITFALIANFGVSFSYALAQSGIDSSLNGILNTLTPLMTMVVGIALFRQHARRLQVIGITTGLVGAGYLVFMQQNGEIGALNAFALFAVLATLGNGLMTNLLKFRLNGLRPLKVASLTFLITLIPSLIFWFGSDAHIAMMTHDKGTFAILMVVLLAILANGLALLLVTKLVQISNPVFASLSTYLIPIVAVGWGVWDGESVYWPEIVAMVVITLSVYLVNKDSG